MTTLQRLQRCRNFSRILARGDALRLAFARQPGPARGYAAPRLGGPLFLRPHTVDVEVFEKVFMQGDYEIPFPIAAERIIDAGAHIGLASRFFAFRYPQASILAVEPVGSNLEVLQRNAATCPRITVRSGAVWGRAAALASTGEESWSHTFREARAGTPSIRASTVPDLMDAMGWDAVDVLKLDVEGAEREIFGDAAASWLPRVKVIVIELHDRMTPGCSRAFYRAIADRIEAQETRGENVFVLLRT